MVVSCGADIGAYTVSLAVRRNTTDDIAFKEFPIDDSETVLRELSAFRGMVVPSVGSGAWRLAKDIEASTGAMIEKHREPVCIWSAIEFLLGSKSPHPNEAYKFVYDSVPSQARYPISACYPPLAAVESCRASVSLEELHGNFPLLLVNVKSGTSFYRIDSPTEFERVGGSSIGAATISGVGAAILPDRDPITRAAMKCSSSIDLLVEDIYGGDCASIGLPGTVIASCLGKAGGRKENPPEEVAKSLMDMVTMNTAQLTNLHARLHGCRMALVVGAIAETQEEHMVLGECMQRVLNILGSNQPGGPLTAIFFERRKFLGCLGALLRREQLLSRLANGSESPSTVIARSSTPINTATMVDYVIDETCTKLRLSPR